LTASTFQLTINPVTSAEFLRWLKQQGCVIDPTRGKGGHVLVTRGDRRSIVPTHGSSKELGSGLVNRIKRDLGLR